MARRFGSASSGPVGGGPRLMTFGALATSCMAELWSGIIGAHEMFPPRRVAWGSSPLEVHSEHLRWVGTTRFLPSSEILETRAITAGSSPGDSRRRTELTIIELDRLDHRAPAHALR